MYLKTALKKIIEKHGKTTYAEIKYFTKEGMRYPRRLDLEHHVRCEEQYLHDCVYDSPYPMKKIYRLSTPDVWGDDLINYDIYSVNEETGEIEINAIVTVLEGLEYEDYEWRKTAKDTKYPTSSKPWWLFKDLN